MAKMPGHTNRELRPFVAAMRGGGPGPSETNGSPNSRTGSKPPAGSPPICRCNGSRSKKCLTKRSRVAPPVVLGRATAFTRTLAGHALMAKRGENRRSVGRHDRHLLEPRRGDYSGTLVNTLASRIDPNRIPDPLHRVNRIGPARPVAFALRDFQASRCACENSFDRVRPDVRKNTVILHSKQGGFDAVNDDFPRHAAKPRPISSYRHPRRTGLAEYAVQKSRQPVPTL